MALSGKYVSIATVMEDVYRDYGFEHELDWADVIEWAAHAVKLVGVPNAYIDKFNCIEIDCHKGQLPCDLHQITSIREKGSGRAMVYTGNTMYLSTLCNSDELKINCTGTDSPDVEAPNIVGTGTSNILSNLGEQSQIPSYHLNNEYIFTSFESGNVEMAYTAFPTDVNGFPLIPDNIKFLKAVSAYIAHKLSFKLWLKDVMSKDKKDALEQEWLFMVGSAKTAASMPSIDQMEAIKNEWMRSIPKINQHATHFQFMHEPERRNINR